MKRLIIALLLVLMVAAATTLLNFTFTVTNAPIATSNTGMSVSGPASLTVSGVSPDTGTFSASGSLSNIVGGNVIVPFTITLGYGTITGNMEFSDTVLVNSGQFSGSATLTGGTGRYAGDVNQNSTSSGTMTGSLLSGGTISFSLSGSLTDGRAFTFSVTNAAVTITGTGVLSGPATLTLAGNSPDTGTFSATASLNKVTAGNLTLPFTITLGQGTLTGNMTFPESALINSGPVTASAAVTGGTASYAGYTSSTLTVQGTVTGSILSTATVSFSVSGTIDAPGPLPPTITDIVNNSSFIPAGFPNSGVAPSAIFAIHGTGMAPATTVTALQDSTKGLPATGGLNGAVVTVSAGGGTYTPGLYYAMATQIAGVLPAAVPPGPATVTVSYNGQTSAAYSFTVVPAAYGIDVYNGNYAVLQDSITGAIITPTNSAKAGEAITIWGTGIGSDPNDSDIFFSSPPHAIPTQVQLYIGNVAVPQSDILYVGSYGYPGVNGVIFIVPSNIPAGCFDSVAVVTTAGGVNTTSNVPLGSFMSSGGVCQDAYTGLNGNTISTLTQQTNVRAGSLFVSQQTSPGTSGAASTQNAASGLFEQVSGSTSLAGIGEVSEGSCSLTQTLVASNSTPPTVTGLNPGTLTVTPPGGSAVTLQTSTAVAGEYAVQLASGAIPASGGTLTFNGSGGSGTNAVGPFSTTVDFPNPIVSWTNESAAAAVTRSAGLNYNWTAGATGTWVIVSGNSASSTASGSYTCVFPQSAITGAVPPYILAALPAGSGTSSLENATSPTSFTASGLDWGIAFGSILLSINSTYQ